MATKLAVPIAAGDLEQAKRQIEAAEAGGAEILELRTDYLKELSVDLVRRLIGEAKGDTGGALPLIVTCRDERQGGVKPYAEELRVDVLVGALQAGAEFIDLEFENFQVAKIQGRIKQALSQRPKARLILSAHNFETKFDDISELRRRILDAHPAAIPKLIYTANHINDCFEAFDLLHNTGGDLIVFCMGEGGLISRILARKLNSFVTFASIDRESATAPGQLRVEQLRGDFRYESIKSDTELFGVIADPVGHSLSPAIHNACFADEGMNRLYLPLLLEGGGEEFDEYLDNVLSREWLGFQGFSVTIPHKTNALDYVKVRGGDVEPLAERIGAVNTLIIKANGKLAAYNTDYSAALDAITSTLEIDRADLSGLEIAVVGAGGVARAIVAGLSDVGANIRIYNRTVERGERLAAEFDCDFAPLDELASLDARLLINCTSVGMYPNVDSTPMPQQCHKKDMAVFDTVYNPVETLLLKQAKEAGAKTIDGLSMFVNQALAQFKLFTGQNGNPDLMRKTICDSLS
jgi:3-dehydroquinate dehydratase/shikimate dehydrogenase